MSGFDAAVPQYNPASQHGPGGSGTVWDSATGAARTALVPGSQRGKRGSGDGSPAQQNPFEHHPIDRQASGKAPRASESDQTAPTVARSSGLSRWTSESRCLCLYQREKFNTKLKSSFLEAKKTQIKCNREIIIVFVC